MHRHKHSNLSRVILKKKKRTETLNLIALMSIDLSSARSRGQFFRRFASVSFPSPGHRIPRPDDAINAPLQSKLCLTPVVTVGYLPPTVRRYLPNSNTGTFPAMYPGPFVPTRKLTARRMFRNQITTRPRIGLVPRSLPDRLQRIR
jgi:hypothetical protein